MVVGGQRDRLFEISGGVHALTAAAAKLGVADLRSNDAALVRQIVELLAVAAGTSHLADTSQAKLHEAQALQQTLNVRAVQATQRDLEAAHLNFGATMSAPGVKLPNDKDPLVDAAITVSSSAQRSKLPARSGSAGPPAPQQAGAGMFSTEIGKLQERSLLLQTAMLHGESVDANELDEVTLRSQEIALTERLIGTIHSTFELQTAAEAARPKTNSVTSAIGSDLVLWAVTSGEFRELGSTCEYIRSVAGPVVNALIAAQKSNDLHGGTPDQIAAHRAARRVALQRAQTAFEKLTKDKDLAHFFQEGAKTVQNQQLRTAILNAAMLLGIAVLAAATGGAAYELTAGMLMEAQGVATVEELSILARAGSSGVNIIADAGVNAVGQNIVQGGSLKQSFIDNLFMSFASTALFGTIARAQAAAAKAEGRQMLTWAKANTAAQKAFLVGKEVGAITVHTIWGAAITYVQNKVLSGHEPTPMEAHEWMLQAASVAIGRRVHAHLGEQMPGLERLAKRTEAKRLLAEAHQLQQLAAQVEQSKNAASAVELLDRRTQLLQDEIEAIQKIVAKDGDATGELGKMRHDLEGQIRESHAQAMLESRFHLLGLEELVPGALWKGTHQDVEHAIAEARKSGGRVSQDPNTKRWKIEIDGRVIQLHETLDTSRGKEVRVEGLAQTPKNYPWRANPDGAVRTVAEARAIAIAQKGSHPR